MSLLSNAWRDLRLAARTLAKSRGFLAVSVLCLALGISANSTMFSLVDGYWTRPLPVRDPGGLVYLSTQTSRGPSPLSYADYVDYRRLSKSFQNLAAMERRGQILVGDGFTEETLSNVVSENYFTLFGVGPAVGRVFTDADSKSGVPVVVMSYNMWKRRFGGDPSIVGRTIQASGSYLVIGVAEKGFRGTELSMDADFWVPMYAWDPSGQEQNDRETRGQEVVGRLRPGVSMASARAELAGIAAVLDREYPKSDRGCRAVLQTPQEYFRGRNLTARLLLAIVGLVLLIACANLASLLLARAASRGHEIGVRLAMGAPRGRLVRQFMAESLLIGGLGTGAGLMLTAWLIRLLPTVLIPPGNSFTHLDLRLDTRVLTYTLAASAATVLLFGLAPALWASRTNLIETIKGGGSSGGSRQRTLGRNVLVAAQVMLSVILLAGAGELVRTFIYGMNLDLGFQRRDLLVVDVGSPYDRRAQTHEFYRQLTERASAMPGVSDVSLALRAPLGPSGGGMKQKITRAEDPADKDGAPVRFAAIGLNYFRTLGIRLVRGRVFDAHDAYESAPVAIVNESMARAFWPGADPIGKAIRLENEPKKERTIVGVVADTHIVRVDEPSRAYFYLPFDQTRYGWAVVIAATRSDAMALARPFRAMVTAMDRRAPVLNVTTMGLLVRSSLYEQQMSATAVGVLGVIGAFLAAVGLYGLISHAVTRRTREIGIRMALGARRTHAMAMILRQGIRLVLVGSALGLVGAYYGTQLLKGLVFGVSVHDPLVFGGVVAVILAVAVMACLMPARRATRIEPMVALREE